MRYVFDWNEWLMPFVLAIGFGLVYLLAMKFCVKPLRFIADNIHTGWPPLIAIPAATIFIIVALSVYSGVYYHRQLFVIIVTIAVEASFLLYIGANGWRTSFPNLPSSLDGQTVSYTVQELSVEGFTSQVVATATDTGFDVVVTNTKEPDEPTPPTPGDKTPEEPTPNEPASNEPTPRHLVGTSDALGGLGIFALLVASAALVLLVGSWIVVRRRNR